MLLSYVCLRSIQQNEGVHQKTRRHANPGNKESHTREAQNPQDVSKGILDDSLVEVQTKQTRWKKDRGSRKEVSGKLSGQTMSE